MHEMSIAGSVIEAVRNAAVQHGGHIAKVGLAVGELAAIDEASLRFCFEALVRDTDLEPIQLEITPAALDELQITYVEVEDE
jgi:hydrogenase nickel incorporation protein HypA/HybF